MSNLTTIKSFWIVWLLQPSRKLGGPKMHRSELNTKKRKPRDLNAKFRSNRLTA